MDKSISIDLGDPRTGLVAEALSNKTCVKILDILAMHELTASDIASKLDIPLNTVGYNLEKLIAAGLVEKSSNFFWSVKGKKTPVYKVANKKIVISPKRVARVLPILFGLGALIVLVIALLSNYDSTYSSSTSSSNELKQFNSNQEMIDYIEKSGSLNSANNVFGFGNTRDSLQVEAPTAESGSALSSQDAKVGGTGGEGYSSTNIQVKGVDEPDTVKNDGNYIYTVNQNRVIIVKAYPADSMKIISELKFDNYVNGIFLDEGKLVVIESSYGYSLYGGAELDKISGTSLIAPDYSRSEVRIHVYDVSSLDSEKNEPKLLKTFASDGNYYTSRIINNHVYLISTKYLDTSRYSIPFFRSGDEVDSISAERVYHFDYYDYNLMFSSVIAIDLDSLDYNGNVFLLGSNSVVYVSNNAIYMLGTKTYDYSKVQEDSLNVLVEVLPTKYGSKVREVIDSKSEYYIMQDRIALILQEYYNSMSLDEKESFEDKLSEASKSYYSKISKEYEKTVINKIEVDGLDINYVKTGEVPGYVLNQFSIDEYEKNLRIATTTGQNFGHSLNHLYVLNEDLEIVGNVNDLADGETIYSARFVGDKAYMVTFRRVDPLYVIDLSDPSSPKVLGYLKVTGFSNYLHPIKDNLLLGIGREATSEGMSEGLKISLFDVTDFENPREVDKYVVDSDYSYSEAEYEHKAVLFDDERDLLVIPVSYSEQLGQYWNQWQGAFVFNVTENDISLKGKISHDIKDSKNKEYYGNDQGYVSRSLFIDDSIYTISNRLVRANALSDLSFISEVKISYEEPIYTIMDSTDRGKDLGQPIAVSSKIVRKLDGNNY